MGRLYKLRRQRLGGVKNVERVRMRISVWHNGPVSPFVYECDNVFIEQGALFAEAFPDDPGKCGIKERVAFASGHWTFYKIEIVIYTIAGVAP